MRVHGDSHGRNFGHCRILKLKTPTVAGAGCAAIFRWKRERENLLVCLNPLSLGQGLRLHS